MGKKGRYVIEKSFKADKQELPHVQEFVQNAIEKCDCSSRNAMQIHLVIEEVFVNIASYAYGNGEGMCNIIVEYDGKDSIMITFEDNGTPFNPLEKGDPDITLSAEKRDVGGLGIFIAKNIMNQVEYEYIEEKNILKMIKKIK